MAMARPGAARAACRWYMGTRLAAVSPFCGTDIQLWPENLPRHASLLLDFDDPVRWHRPPLQDSAVLYTENGSKLAQAACALDRRVYASWIFFLRPLHRSPLDTDHI